MLLLLCIVYSLNSVRFAVLSKVLAAEAIATVATAVTATVVVVVAVAETAKCLSERHQGNAH